MGTYTTTKCGNCGHAFETLNYGRHSIVGPPKIKCASCNTINMTSFKLYRDMGMSNKIYFWIGQVFGTAIMGLVSFIIGVSWLYYMTTNGDYVKMWEIDNYIGLLILGGIPISLLFKGVFHIKDLSLVKKSCEAIEDLYDKNGGFILSDQYFND
ncbi:hypothetical protein [Marinifilum flexuosum]|uniref:hypothetical protein n=1 Tax=Marinifilum flexuosum TaxID=1117708 RepID=UPI0024947ABF|nr:hypothetical protein [Marinifilum flexuosum]